jgi:hypothetical protein
MRREVRQSFYGKRYCCGYWMGAPRENSICNQFDKNALEQVVDTMGEPCSRSTERERVDFVDKTLSARGLSSAAVQRSPRRW